VFRSGCLAQRPSNPAVAGSSPARGVYIQVTGDSMAEWLRRVIRNHMGYARVGSNPTAVVQMCLLSSDGRALAF
jgi:hypothetical protein